MNILGKHPMWSLVAATVVIVWALFSIFRSPRAAPAITAAVDRYYDDLARQAEQATAHLENGAGVVLLVLDQGKGLGSGKRFDRLFALLKNRGLSIRHVESLVHDEKAGWDSILFGFPYAEYVRVAREHPDAAAVLSLCGAPYGATGADRSGRSKRPPLLVTGVDRWSPALQALLDDGRVAVAIVPRDKAPEGDVPADGFEASFKRLTAPGVP